MTRLLQLRLRHVALVRDAHLECERGFGILTGETGAGKSLCIAALRFVLGGRADGDLAGEGTSVSAVFELGGGDLLPLAAVGVAVDDLITLTREVGGNGRTSCRINGALVSQATLREVGEALAEVTSQGASHRLLRRGWQRRALDDFGGRPVAEAQSEMSAAQCFWRAAESALGGARDAGRRTAADLDDAGDIIAELGDLDLRAGEEEELAVERLRLRQTALIAAAAAGLAGAATGGEDERGAATLLDGALAEIEGLGGIDPVLAELGDEVAGLAARLRDVSLAARRHADRVEFDAGRLERLEERLDVLARVRRRHGSVAAATGVLQAARQLRAAATDGVNLARLENEAVQARIAARAAAERLTGARAAGARRLERAVEQRLSQLELPHARFRIILGVTAAADGLDTGSGSVRCDADGVDTVEFRLAANQGGVPLPLDEGPSGGELSRLALALAAVAGAGSQPLLVLDEVDSGIGGETAARVGDLLAEIAAGRQVIAVTHRPEIAARAGWHLLVVKRHRGGRPESVVFSVQGDARVAEIARLMSGRTTSAALARAGELLDEGGLGRRTRRAAS